MEPQQDTPPSGQFDQVVERLKSANNVLVTVTTNPTVDQLAACIGMTITLNKLGKHATAVFSGDVPATIDFLQPEKTLEKNTDSLRDFIIALDKSKADKLRYKVEDSVVKIFITPYKTSISDKDLDFSQGDFNVDAVVALGVHDKVQLDAAILAHGRILHDATILSLNTSGGNQLGSVAWVEPNASSLCEMVGDVARELSANVFDAQISTALLTGIVAETDRFSNQKASPHTMSVAGILMAAGASTQLVTSKLEEANKKEELPVLGENEDESSSDGSNNKDGMIEIEHVEGEEAPAESTMETPDVPGAIFDDHLPEDDSKFSEPPHDEPSEPATGGKPGPKVMFEPPQLGGQLTANSVPEYQQYSDSTDPLSNADDKSSPILNRSDKPADVDNDKTLSEIEQAVDSPHLTQQEEAVSDVPSPPPVDDVRTAVEEATVQDEYTPEPIDALGAQAIDLDPSPPPPVPPPMMPPTS